MKLRQQSNSHRRAQPPPSSPRIPQTANGLGRAQETASIPRIGRAPGASSLRIVSLVARSRSPPTQGAARDAAFDSNADGVIGSLSLTPRSAASAVTSLEVRIGMPADGVHGTPFRTAVAVPRSLGALVSYRAASYERWRRRGAASPARCGGDCAAWQPSPGCHGRPCTGETAYPRIESAAMGVGPSRR